MPDLRLWHALVPFIYTAQTRLKSRRDYLYVISSQWGLGLIALYFLSQSDPKVVLFNYMVGYIAFISIYEIGYLTNDTWDAKRGEGGRKRFEYDVTVPFILFFVIVRIGIWTLLTCVLLRGDLLFWLVANAALVVVYFFHNILRAPDIRYATFVQLTLFRFALPIMFSLPQHALEPIIIVTFLHYLHFRGLAYLASKELLTMPQRKESNFGLRHTMIILPIVICLYISTNLLLYPAAWGYTTAIYTVFSLWSQRQT